MKRIFFLVGLSTITAFAFSQTTHKYVQDSYKPIEYGIHAGINVSSMTDKVGGVSETAKSIVGFTGGVDVTFHLSPVFAIQPELNFSQMGGKETQDNTTYKLNLDYLALPVLAKYTVPNTGFSVYLGPEIGYLLHTSASSSGVSVSMSDYMNKIDFLGALGVEYYFPQHFGISARYQLGFANIYKSQGSGDNETLKNHGFSVTVGYRF